MTPSQIISIVRDAVILLALGFIVYWIWHSGEDRVKLADMKAVQQQLSTNSQIEARNAALQLEAESTHVQELAKINSAIANQHAPLWMCRPPHTSVVSSPAIPTEGAHPARGAADAGPGSDPQPIDIRAAINGYEKKYELALADCRQALATWPRGK